MPAIVNDAFVVKSKSTKSLLEQYRQKSQELLPELSYERVVLPEVQLTELTHLKETIQYERFFFVVDLQKMEIRNISGVARWLGYHESDFNFYKYLKIVHPAHVTTHTIASMSMLEGLMKGQLAIEFMKHRYVTLIALQHKNGHYLLCKRLACVFQVDPQKRLLEYINEFTVISRHNEEPFAVMPASDEGENKEWLTELMKHAKNFFQGKNFFSVQELRILRKYAYDKNISLEQIANSINVEKSSVMTYNKRILEKAADLCSKRFSNAREVGLALKEAGLL